AILLRVPDRSTLDWWAQRLRDLGVTYGAIDERAGRATLPFSDFEGQRLELVAPATGEQAHVPGGAPWPGSPVAPEQQIRGLHGVRLIVARRDATVRLLTETLEFREAGTYTLSAEEDGTERPVQIFQMGDGGPGAEVHLEVRDDLRLGHVGVGGVHH